MEKINIELVENLSLNGKIQKLEILDDTLVIHNNSLITYETATSVAKHVKKMGYTQFKKISFKELL